MSYLACPMCLKVWRMNPLTNIRFYDFDGGYSHACKDKIQTKLIKCIDLEEAMSCTQEIRKNGKST